MLKVKAKFSEKIWGGSKLKNYGFNIPSNKTGEAWIISAYHGNASYLENGQTLRELYEKRKDLFNNYPTKEFPLLAKILDADENLSVQVHPNDENAKKLENYPFGKTECWYVLEATKNKDIIVGINVDNKEEARTLIENREWSKLWNTQPIKRGDIFEIEAGTVHAINAGTVVYELQQSSDITYRMYDYDRVDDHGNQRELHIDKSLQVINYKESEYKKEPTLIKEIGLNKFYSLIENKLFNLEKWVISEDVKLSFGRDDKNFLLVTVIEGEFIINCEKLNSYESGIITADELSFIDIKGKGIILVGNPNK